MRSLLFLAALVGASLLCAPARADDAEREGRALFDKGNQHIRDGDYAGALELFQSAYAKYPNVKILLNIGTMLRQLGRNAEAVEAYEAYLRDPAADAGRKAEVGKLLAALDARVTKLHVTVDDPTATVLVDGKASGKPGGVVMIRVEPGPHAITTDGGKGPPAVKNIMAVAGQEMQIALSAAPPTPPPAPAPPAPEAEASGNGKRTGGFVVGGLGIAGLVVGGATGIVSLLDHSAAVNGCPSHRGCSQDVLDKASTGKTLGTVSTVAFAVGAVGVGVGLTLVLTSGRPASAPSVGFSLAPDGGRVGFRGSF